MRKKITNDKERYSVWVRDCRRMLIRLTLSGKDPQGIVKSFVAAAVEFGFNKRQATHDAEVIVAWAVAYKAANPGSTPKELLASLPIK